MRRERWILGALGLRQITRYAVFSRQLGKLCRTERKPNSITSITYTFLLFSLLFSLHFLGVVSAHSAKTNSQASARRAGPEVKALCLRFVLFQDPHTAVRHGCEGVLLLGLITADPQPVYV